jgi:hypothetical protein
MYRCYHYHYHITMMWNMEKISMCFLNVYLNK